MNKGEQKKSNIIVLAMLIGLLVMFTVGCGSDLSTKGTIGETYNPVIDPANFVTKIDNQYLPLTPGMVFIYQGETEDGIERNEVYVTDQTKEILGVTCIVVRDRVWDEDDELAEETYDWYAQDKDGNVWYFGEDSKEYEDGVFESTEGSWEAGVDGAKPGIIMQANPQIGDSYRQEYYEGEAEDMGEVLSLSESVSVPYGSFENCLKTKDWTLLEPGTVEHKYYAPGVGLVLETVVEGDWEHLALVDITTDIELEGSGSEDGLGVEDIDDNNAEQDGNGTKKDVENEEVELEGAIDRLTDTGMVVGGLEIDIDENTEIDSTLAVGTIVEVEVIVQDDGSFVATEIEVEGEDVDENDDEEVELEGPIDRLTDTGIVVAGLEMFIDENTEIEGTLAVGAIVEVEVIVQDDGSLVAIEIEIEDDDEEDEDDD